MRVLMMGVVGVVFLLAASAAYAVDVTFTFDANIIDGDYYDVVWVYDSPPDQTTVDMFGGSVRGFMTYDFSVVNIYDGELRHGASTYNSSVLNIYGGLITFEGSGFGDSSIVNLYGGDVSIGTPGFAPEATMNIYGYGFSYDGWRLRGYLSDGSVLDSMELTWDDYAHINLHIIPEPATIAILSFGLLVIRKRR